MTKETRLFPLMICLAAATLMAGAAMAAEASRIEGRGSDPAPDSALRKVQVGALLSAPMSDVELSLLRGGFFTAAGAQFDFGANVTTLVNGQVALHGTLNWTPTGLAVQQIAGRSAVGVMQSDPLGLQATIQSGQTQVFNNFSNGQVQSFVINSANDQMISQNTNITLTVYNFSEWQGDITRNMISSRLASEVMSSSALGVLH